MIQIAIDGDPTLTDIIPIVCGEHRCPPSHSFGPFVRDYFMLHYCLCGKGVIQDVRGVHNVGAGEFFIIRPGESTVYTADAKDPWHYVWIGFSGKRAELFRGARTVELGQREIFTHMASLAKERVSSPDIYVAAVFQIIHHLFRAESTDRGRINTVKNYLDYNYMDDMSMDRLSNLFSLERSYLYRLFKNTYGVGIKEYLTSLRMEKAKHFLQAGHSVSACAHMVGYTDEFNFSKSFKKRVGVAPVRFAAASEAPEKTK